MIEIILVLYTFWKNEWIMNSQNSYFACITWIEHWDPFTLHLLREFSILAYTCDKNLHENISFVTWTLDAAPSHRAVPNPEIGLATERLRAIDLSCRACGAGAGCKAWIPARGTFGFERPNSDSKKIVKG